MDQMSQLAPYSVSPLSSRISGAMYSPVPTMLRSPWPAGAGVEGLGEAEVAELESGAEGGGAHEEAVLGLDVAMGVAEGVEVGQGAEELEDVELGEGLWEALFVVSVEEERRDRRHLRSPWRCRRMSWW